MAAPLKAVDSGADLQALMTDLGIRARAAARVLALAPPEQKNRALEAIERAIRANAAKMLAANAEDVAEVRAGGATAAFLDRLTLTPGRIESMADGVERPVFLFGRGKRQYPRRGTRAGGEFGHQLGQIGVAVDGLEGRGHSGLGARNKAMS